MSDLPALLERNRNIADAFKHGDLPIRSRLSTVVLTCVDARVDPATSLTSDPATQSSSVTPAEGSPPAVMGDLAVLGVLAANMPGTTPMQPELVVIHHTDCGMGRLADPTIQQQVAKRLGLSVDQVAAMAITDPTTTVRDDIERLRHTPETPDELVVSGLVYDVAAGDSGPGRSSGSAPRPKRIHDAQRRIAKQRRRVNVVRRRRRQSWRSL